MTARWRRALELGVALLSVAAAFGSFWQFYGAPWWIPPVAGALGGGAGLALAWERLRMPGWLLPPVAALLGAVLVLYTAFWRTTSAGVPGPSALRATADGLVSGWARMLTVALPADPTGDVLVLPVVLAWAAGIVTCLVVRRTAWRAVTALPALLVLGVGLALTAQVPDRGLTATVATVSCVLLLLLVRSDASAEEVARSAARPGPGGPGATPPPAVPPGRPWARLLLGVPGAALVVVGALLVATTLPLADGSDRADPRAAYPQPLQLRPALSPLVEVMPQVREGSAGDGSAPAPPVELYRVRPQWPADVDVPEGNRAVRVAALDVFDGALWSASGEFRRAGTRLPRPAPPLSPTAAVEVEVEVVQARSDFLPVLGRPVRAQGLDMAVDGSSGTLVAVDPLEAGDTYSVVSQVAAREDLPAAAAGSVPGAGDLPGAPDWVATTAQEILDSYPPQERDTVWEQLTALEDWYRGRPYDRQARPGHSYAALFRTLSGDGEEAAGHAEQYATGFAVLARSLGYSTRVAVGYRLDPQRVDGAGWYTVTTADADAWPEVWLDGFGWWPFDPTNEANDIAAPQDEPPPQPPLADEPGDVVPAQPDPGSEEGTDDADAGGSRLTTRQVLAWGLLVIAGLVALLVLLQVAAVVAKVVRRGTRRRRGPPARRVVAAWSETRDRLRELGYPAPACATAAEIAATALDGPARDAAPDVAELAVITTSAVFSPVAPQEPAAVRAWELEASVRRRIARLTPPHRRVLAFLDPRALLRPLGRPPAAAPAPVPDTGASRAAPGPVPR